MMTECLNMSQIVPKLAFNDDWVFKHAPDSANVNI